MSGIQSLSIFFTNSTSSVDQSFQASNSSPDFLAIPQRRTSSQISPSDKSISRFNSSTRVSLSRSAKSAAANEIFQWYPCKNCREFQTLYAEMQNDAHARVDGV